MIDYFRRFKSLSAYTEYVNSSGYTLPNVSVIDELSGGNVRYTPKPIAPDPLKDIVFYAPLLSDTKDIVSDSIPSVIGTLGSFDDKGLYFDGHTGLKWSFSQLAFDPSTINYNTSFTLLLDFYRISHQNGHDVFFELGDNPDKDIFFMYEKNWNAICCNIASARFGDGVAISLNTQYNNCGFWYDGVNHVGYRIIEGIVDFSNSIASSVSASILIQNYLYIGFPSYGTSRDAVHGYIKNVRFYLTDFNKNMVI